SDRRMTAVEMDGRCPGGGRRYRPGRTPDDRSAKHEGGRGMSQRRTPSLTPDEALALHREALVIDSQQPFVTWGIVFTPGMRETLARLVREGRTMSESSPILSDALAREIQTS